MSIVLFGESVLVSLCIFLFGESVLVSVTIVLFGESYWSACGLSCLVSQYLSA